MDLIRRANTIKMSRPEVWETMLDTHEEAEALIEDILYHGWYILGDVHPRFQVPAIRQGFEFGYNLTEQKPVLLTWVQGRY